MDTVVAELVAVLLDTDDIEVALRYIADAVSRTLIQRPLVLLTVHHDGQVLTALSAGTELIDGIQHTAAHGPHLACLRTGQPILTTRASDAQRELPAGVHSLCAYPLRAYGKVTGVLALYSRTPDRLSTRTLLAVQAAADSTGLLLNAATHLTRRIAVTAQLRQALRRQVVIDQAIGVIMALLGCDADTALDNLRLAAQPNRCELADVAAGVVASTGLMWPGPGTSGQ
ncbi:GAF domain-containing protein [Kutzneria viridogrisea]|uniref:ANTAR domain-containing protein n=2 Tax=Kutzneria TaxID=43356 RepID=W5W0P4_9PSEU|nr:GAF and ANTAR domain-containing protein [Kutzneria albida]AHH94728.1 hypothetical protein KALB_1355 [Kutzneria albida DSM 43870]MBA8930397.1 GAF domain-containing protein [Kutzneria viridogrisea]